VVGWNVFRQEGSFLLDRVLRAGALKRVISVSLWSQSLGPLNGPFLSAAAMWVLPQSLYACKVHVLQTAFLNTQYLDYFM
jgi:hypothetical protein